MSAKSIKRREFAHQEGDPGVADGSILHVIYTEQDEPSYDVNVGLVNRSLGMTRGGGESGDLRMAEQLKDMRHGVSFYIGKPIRSDPSSPVEDFRTVVIWTPHFRDMGMRGALGYR